MRLFNCRSKSVRAACRLYACSVCFSQHRCGSSVRCVALCHYLTPFYLYWWITWKLMSYMYQPSCFALRSCVVMAIWLHAVMRIRQCWISWRKLRCCWLDNCGGPISDCVSTRCSSCVTTTKTARAVVVLTKVGGNPLGDNPPLAKTFFGEYILLTFLYFW